MRHSLLWHWWSTFRSLRLPAAASRLEVRGVTGFERSWHSRASQRYAGLTGCDDVRTSQRCCGGTDDDRKQRMSVCTCYTGHDATDIINAAWAIEKCARKVMFRTHTRRHAARVGSTLHEQQRLFGLGRRMLS